MPNWKYPCLNCTKPVKTNQKGLECNICTKWVHFKCTELNELQYDYLEQNLDVPFYCLGCKPRLLYSDLIFENTDFYSDTDQNDSSLSSDFSSAHSSDFEFIDTESDFESRGLNFESLPVQNNSQANTKKRNTNKKYIPVQARNYKYPCLVCHSPCKDNVQDSISCTLCDEWVHQKCSDLTLNRVLDLGDRWERRSAET